MGLKFSGLIPFMDTNWWQKFEKDLSIFSLKIQDRPLDLSWNIQYDPNVGKSSSL